MYPAVEAFISQKLYFLLRIVTSASVPGLHFIYKIHEQIQSSSRVVSRLNATKMSIGKIFDAIYC